MHVNVLAWSDTCSRHLLLHNKVRLFHTLFSMKRHSLMYFWHRLFHIVTSSLRDYYLQLFCSKMTVIKDTFCSLGIVHLHFCHYDCLVLCKQKFMDEPLQEIYRICLFYSNLFLLKKENIQNTFLITPFPDGTWVMIKQYS